jgi:hypothetical protein
LTTRFTAAWAQTLWRAGADQFLGDIEVGADSVADFADFNPAEDRLALTLDVDGGDGTGLSLMQGDNPGMQILFYGANLVARITSAAPFDLSDIEISLRLKETDPEEGIVFSATPGDDIIRNVGWGHIDAGAGNDTVYADGSTIYGVAGNDRLAESGESFGILYGGDGADTLSAVGNNFYSNGTRVSATPNFTRCMAATAMIC